MSAAFSYVWKKYAGGVITAAQALSDFMAIFLAFWTGYYSYMWLGGLPPQKPIDYLIIATGAAALFVTVFKSQNMYKRELSLLNVSELRNLFVSLVWGSTLFLALTFYIRSFTLSRVTITVSLVATVAYVLVERLIFYRVHLYFHMRGFSQKKVLIYGAGQVGKHLLKRLYQSPALGYACAGFVDDDSAKTGQYITFKEYPRARGNQVLGTSMALEDLVKRLGIEEIFIAMPSANYDSIKRAIELCKKLGVPYSIVPQAYDILIQKLTAFEIGGIPILRIRHTQPSRVYLFAKRIVDILVALILIVVFSPFYILFGLMIKFDSKGPIIFKQKRVGLYGKEFSFYKFRTMHVEAPAYASTPKSANDPRITRLGRWLRRTSLDELPQLFNVLRGDMSMVGPRPEMPFIVSEYGPLERERLNVKPGITGVWQISAVRGEPIHANIEYDLYYIENQSLLLDFVILVKTVFGVIRGVGAV
jgi:exopolysaccharide biosynthesis polyprenyl glycosylphosphotransferase